METASIVSVTDPEGNITYANDEFCRVSGYSREELIGNNHRIIRHPDMPSATYAGMWATIKANRVWKGLIMNRAKS